MFHVLEKELRNETDKFKEIVLLTVFHILSNVNRIMHTHTHTHTHIHTDALNLVTEREKVTR